MIDDILMILQHLQSEEKGELLIHWLPDTFRADWKLEWSGEMISINANWESLKGDLQEVLVNSKKVEVLKSEFMNEWKIRNEIVMKTLILNGSPRINGDTSRLIKKFTEKR